MTTRAFSGERLLPYAPQLLLAVPQYRVNFLPNCFGLLVGHSQKSSALPLLQGATVVKIYKNLTGQERAVVMTIRDDLCSLRSVAKRLCRSVSTISRELQSASGAGAYDANLAQLQCQVRRIAPRRVPKRHRDSVLFQVVRHQLSLLYSRQQIARKLRLLWPENPEKSMSHETIYNAIYVYPRGVLKRWLICNISRFRPADA